MRSSFKTQNLVVQLVNMLEPLEKPRICSPLLFHSRPPPLALLGLPMADLSMLRVIQLEGDFFQFTRTMAFVVKNLSLSH